MTDKKNTFHFFDTVVFKKAKEYKVIQFRELGNKKFKVSHVESLSAETFAIIVGLQKEKDSAIEADDLQKMVKTTIDIVYLAQSQKNKVERAEMEKVGFDVFTNGLGWILRPVESGERFLEEGH